MEVIIWGCGGYYSLISGIIHELEINGTIRIKAYVCRNAQRGESIDGHLVVDKAEVKNLNYDKIVIMADLAKESIKEDIRQLGITDEKVMDVDELLRGSRLNELAAFAALNQTVQEHVRRHTYHQATTAYTYRLSIAAIVRDEADILEWIEYHRMVGVEHFYIYDNESTDGLENRLAGYIRDGIVTYLYYPGERVQARAYQHAVKHFANDTKWLAIIDGDEYMVPVRGGIISDICDGIEQFFYNQLVAQGSVGAIAVNWRTYGTSFHKCRPQGLVIENYTWRAEDDSMVNSSVKSIVNPRAVTETGIHVCALKEGYYCVSENGTPIVGPHIFESVCRRLRINHYHSKSEEELKNKFLRGWPDQEHIKEQEDILKRKVRDNARLNNDIEDMIMLRYVEDVKKRLEEMTCR